MNDDLRVPLSKDKVQANNVFFIYYLFLILLNIIFQYKFLPEGERCIPSAPCKSLSTRGLEPLAFRFGV